MASNSNSDVVVVMVPFPEYGHQIPLLRLSQLISSYNIPVHYMSIGARNQELKQRQQNQQQFPKIQFHNLSITSKENADEEDYLSYLESLLQIGEPLRAICHSNNGKRVVIIHDAMMQYVVETVYTISHVETYFFHAVSAFTTYSMLQQIREDEDEENEENSKYNDVLFSSLQAHVPSIESCFKPGMGEFTKLLRDCKFKSGEILNTCREIEEPYLDALCKQSDTPFWGLGPFNPVNIVQDTGKIHRCIEWLDKQPVNSVIFVSFGTANDFSIEQIHEIAIGLERSEQKFIWVLRGKDKKGENLTSEIQEIELPNGFEERVKERGIIAREWVPQLEILAHPSTGGYFFHSGWNSFLESATMGVPMATWPLNSDNPYNDVLITKVLRIGLVVRDWAHKDELMKSDKIEIGVRTLMNSPEGEEMRQRAVELSKAIKMSVGDGGSQKKQMDSFIAHITR
ncbi:zeatin O-glucosyltransferase-like [Solanum dulcamara]|uniref:zeatin O-glucosyltransferase-like n=1 Tax=Solanum dulcamara TaxID=45834 RepID=UPI002485759C|nr:zeatin O-glucosyltransferase-like [Solanum dulcamara]